MKGHLGIPVVVLACMLVPVPGALSPAAGGEHEISFSAASAWTHLEAIMAFNPRYPGTPGINQTVAYIEQHLLGVNASVVFHDFVVNGVPCTNVIGKVVPPSPDGTVVMVATHHDARARADMDPDPARRNDPVPAANDGGSSTAAVLELASVLAPLVQDLAGSIQSEVWFTFFDVEDQGNGGMGGFGWIEGSTRLASELDSFLPQNGSVSMMVLLDMIGGTGARMNRELNSDQVMLSEVFAMGQCLGYEVTFPRHPVSRRIIDDHVPFVNKGIPSIDIIDLDYPQWHTVADTLEHVSAASIGAVGRTVEAFLVSKLANVSSIHDDETGRTWAPGECLGDPFWMFTAFVSRWWPVLVLAGVAGTALGIASWRGRKKSEGARDALTGSR